MASSMLLGRLPLLMVDTMWCLRSRWAGLFCSLLFACCFLLAAFCFTLAAVCRVLTSVQRTHLCQAHCHITCCFPQQQMLQLCVIMLCIFDISPALFARFPCCTLTMHACCYVCHSSPLTRGTEVRVAAESKWLYCRVPFLPTLRLEWRTLQLSP